MKKSKPQRYAFHPTGTEAIGVDQKVLRRCARTLGVSKRQAMCLALNRLYVDLNGGRADFDVPQILKGDDPGPAAHFTGLQALFQTQGLPAG